MYQKGTNKYIVIILSVHSYKGELKNRKTVTPVNECVKDKPVS